MLVLAGAGLHRGHFTRELVEELSRADVVYVEDYTMPGGLGLLNEVRRYAPKAVRAPRRLLEEEADRVVEEASVRRVVVVTAGHPLIATTHVSLIALARMRGVKVRVLQGISGVVAAMTATGLDFYKFGRIVTVPGPWRQVKPYSIMKYLYLNTAAGMHTMLLLDIAEDGRQLCLGEAVDTLLELDEAGILQGSPMLLVANAGMSGERVEPLEPRPGLGCHDGVASLVYPGGLSRIEAENLEAIYGVKLDPKLYQEAGAKATRLLREWLDG